MKKFGAFLAGLALTLCLTACNNNVLQAAAFPLLRLFRATLQRHRQVQVQ